MPTLVIDETFEEITDLSTAYTVNGTPTIGGNNVVRGSKALRITGGGAQNIKKTTSGSPTVVVDRFYVTMPVGGTPATAQPTLWQAQSATGKSFQVKVTLAGVVQTIITGGTAKVGPTLVEGQTYRVDVRADCSGTTYTLDWQIDGVDETQATVTGQTASTFSFRILGNGTTASSAFTFDLDEWAASDTSADYPIGPAPADPSSGPVGQRTADWDVAFPGVV